jgi:tRNA threonylcarbamoyladenosine biosynthesis protein TsaE
MNLRLTSGGPSVTFGVGEALGRVAEGPLALLLVGDYGTGKTTFVKGLAAGLDIEDLVRSPSYNIVKRYSMGRRVLVHADLYRTRTDPDIEELGLLEMASEDGILAVEWPGRYLVPAREMPNLMVVFSFLPDGQSLGEDDQRRNLEFTWQDDCPAGIVEVLSALAAR